MSGPPLVGPPAAVNGNGNGHREPPRIWGMPLEAAIRTGLLLLALGAGYRGIEKDIESLRAAVADMKASQVSIAGKVDQVILRELDRAERARETFGGAR